MTELQGMVDRIVRANASAMKMRDVDVICRMLTTKRNELKKLGHPQPEDAGIVRLALIAKIQVLEWVLGENRWEGI